MEIIKEIFGYFLNPMKKSFSFAGRADPQEFWLFMLWEISLQILFWFGLMVVALFTTEKNVIPFLVTLGFNVLYSLLVFPARISISVRRLHDSNLTGSYLLLSLLPFVGGLIYLVLMLFPSTEGKNRFDSDWITPQKDTVPQTVVTHAKCLCPWCGHNNTAGAGYCSRCHKPYEEILGNTFGQTILQ